MRIALLIAAGTVIAGAMATVAEPTTNAIPNNSTNASTIGWEFEGESQLNQGKLTETVYFGECSGIEAEFKPARFTSTKTQPDNKRRVIVRNITRGLASDPLPYTNREYQTGRASEATQIEFGTKHSPKRFRVLPGANEFEYEVRDRKKVIDSGRFTATIAKLTKRIERNAQWYEEEVCANTAVSNNVCADLRERKQYRCPDGKVLKSIMANEEEAIRTLLSNQTDKAVTVTIEGDLYRIEAGESLRLRRKDSFTVKFSGGETLKVQAGKRMKFQTKRNNPSQIELVDYPRKDD
jgi:hypothetical protein